MKILVEWCVLLFIFLAQFSIGIIFPLFLFQGIGTLLGAH